MAELTNADSINAYAIITQIFYERSEAMRAHLNVGDHVEWQTSQGPTTGRIKQKLTAPTEIKGHHVAASTDDPQYLVESDTTGEQAAHKPSALKKVRA